MWMGRSTFPPSELTFRPFTVADARKVGVERWHLRGANWRRVARGMYVWSGLEQTPMSLLAVARERLPSSAVFSGLTGAWLHGIDVQPCDPIEVTVPRSTGIGVRAGIRVHRATSAVDDVVQIRGFRVTSIVRTIADLCRRLPLIEAVVIVDAALHSRRVTLAQLSQSARGTMKRVIQFAEPAAESPMESRLRMILVLGGLPRPKAQVSIYDPSRRFAGRVDLYYEEARLAIEYDGATHRTSLAEDNRRQNRLLQAGVRLLRFTAADVFHSATSIVAQVRSALHSS